MSADIIQKTSVTFLCKDLSSTSNAHYAVLINYLCSHSCSVNLITDERQCGNEYRYHSSTTTYSFDAPVRFACSRKTVLSDFINLCKDSLFVVSSADAKNMCDDVSTIVEAGEKVVVFEDTPLLSLLSRGNVSLYKESLKVLSQADAVISFSHTAFEHLNLCNIKNAFYVPYLYPFTNGEFSKNDDANSIVLLFDDKSIDNEKIRNILQFVKTESPDSDIIVKGLDENNFEKDERTSFTNDKYDSFIESCNNALLFYTIPYIDSFAVSLSAREIPFQFFSPFCDDSTGAVTPENITIPKKSVVFTLDEQESIAKKYLLFFESILNGNIDLNIFQKPGAVDSGFSVFFEKLKQQQNYYNQSNQSSKGKSALKNLFTLPIDYFNFLESRRYAKYKINQTSDETVRKLQLLALYMLDEFERICKKHSLRYYIAAGSLLGAVRHGGVIPWDDDIDVTMPRPDYEKFITVAQSELSSDMVLPKDNFPYGFTRIMMKDTVINRLIRQKGAHGVFLDVLPLDGAAPDESSAKIHSEDCKKILHLMLAGSLPIPRLKPDKSSATALVYRMIIKCIPKSILKRKWKEICFRYNTEESDSWICLAGTYGYEKECFPKEYWGTPVMMMYSGAMRPVMSEWETYLKSHYGDYMHTPPLLMRRTHGALSINLGKYENMSIEELENHLNNKRKEVVLK